MAHQMSRAQAGWACGARRARPCRRMISRAHKDTPDTIKQACVDVRDVPVPTTLSRPVHNSKPSSHPIRSMHCFPPIPPLTTTTTTVYMLLRMQVSAWLGVDAGAVLQQETNPAIEAMFDKPHPSL